MAVSFAEQHQRRVDRLVEGVKAYAREANITESTASRRVLNQSGELERLEKGGTLKPYTLELREKRLKELRRSLKAGLQAVSAA